ncbi:alpha/beta-hydrolase [Schizophyllum commune H4-8]|uniref:alpha/beta-hydrolase n=1 Tax=Schizophyllum commune (strain H4-8 / FGSC 9210) TaxID=578458 RepID=UPI00215DED3C|nr:alpha/beta-hydrolase [Schizophyllum commune H4-8]KAI5892391.1 alpha/beta-hydrolase [Schizophyllum commune H4-8]
MSSPSPFKIAVPEEKLALLHQKVELVTWPDELEDAGSDYGATPALVKRLANRWSSGYDWRAQEAAINAELPQFTTNLEVEGHGKLNIHFVHKKSEVAHAIPLLFVHGWPGSFLEARKIIPLLTAASEKHPSFHVVAVSLPGYGFSEAPTKRGFGLPEYAEICYQLMGTLGYTQYVAQGGDWGMSVARVLASKYGSTSVKAWHTNFPFGHPDTEHPIESCTPEEQNAWRKTSEFRETEMGYVMVQGTKPQTIAYALTDSPVGLLAWIAEKLLSWGDEYPWTDDEILTWVSLYWLSRAGPAATFRTYYEAMQRPGLGSVFNLVEKEPTIPLGLSFFPRELSRFPRAWTRQMGNVVFEADHDKGGHFAAYEVPEALADDLRRMFGKEGVAYGVVDGLDGYATSAT